MRLSVLLCVAVVVVGVLVSGVAARRSRARPVYDEDEWEFSSQGQGQWEHYPEDVDFENDVYYPIRMSGRLAKKLAIEDQVNGVEFRIQGEGENFGWAQGMQGGQQQQGLYGSSDIQQQLGGLGLGQTQFGQQQFGQQQQQFGQQFGGVNQQTYGYPPNQNQNQNVNVQTKKQVQYATPIVTYAQPVVESIDMTPPQMPHQKLTAKAIVQPTYRESPMMTVSPIMATAPTMRKGAGYTPPQPQPRKVNSLGEVLGRLGVGHMEQQVQGQLASMGGAQQQVQGLQQQFGQGQQQQGQQQFGQNNLGGIGAGNF